MGRGDRLLGRAVDLRRDPEARRRELSPHPQHAALPARQHVRLRCRAATRCRSPSCSRSTATRWRRRATLADAVDGDYARYEFHLVVQRLQTYCSEDLGGFYLDVLKDRLYTTARDSRARRSAQTALAHIRDALLQLMAPVLSFTAEEAWRIVRPDDADDLLPHVGRRAAARCPTPTRCSPSGRASSPCAPPCRRSSRTLRQAGSDRLVAAGRGRDRRAGGRLRRARDRSATTCASC